MTIQLEVATISCGVGGGGGLMYLHVPSVSCLMLHNE
jgi:hypothetical protein